GIARGRRAERSPPSLLRCSFAAAQYQTRNNSRFSENWEKSGAISPFIASFSFAEASIKTSKQFPRQRKLLSREPLATLENIAELQDQSNIQVNTSSSKNNKFNAFIILVNRR